MGRTVILFLALISSVSYSAEITVGNPEVSGCAPIGIG